MTFTIVTTAYEIQTVPWNDRVTWAIVRYRTGDKPIALEVGEACCERTARESAERALTDVIARDIAHESAEVQ